MSALEKLLSAAKAYREANLGSKVYLAEALFEAARDPALDEPAWTSERPTEPGRFYVHVGSRDVRIAEVDRDDLDTTRLVVSFCGGLIGDWVPMEKFGPETRWCPIPEPPEHR